MDLIFNYYLILTLIALFSVNQVLEVNGHGLGSEIFPPVDLNGKQVSLELNSSQNYNQEDDLQISISIIDFNSKVTLRDVTFLIKSSKGGQFLFEKEFQAKNGFLVFNFISSDQKSILIEEEDQEDFFGSLLGLESRKINIKGPKLSEGGLYKFDISIITVDNFSKKLEDPLVFNAGISIPQTKVHQIDHPDFGLQQISTITYYDEISNFQYDYNLKEISFFMPFDWSINNINQTTVVHEELVIPKTFGDFLASGFSSSVNGIELPPETVTIDDFSTESRIIHFIIPQNELKNIYDNFENQNGMEFSIEPNLNTQLSSITNNGQYGVSVSWEPENLKSGSQTKFNFNIYDVFLKSRSLSIFYDFSLTSGGKIVFEKNGISDTENPTTIEVFIPEGTKGIANLNFQNIGNNNSANTTFPIIIDSKISDAISIPQWIKTNASWWSLNQIDDDTFILGIEYLIKNKIIVIPKTVKTSTEKDIPQWIKTNASWWSTGKIDDKTFAQGLQFLILKGIIRV